MPFFGALKDHYSEEIRDFVTFRIDSHVSPFGRASICLRTSSVRPTAQQPSVYLELELRNEEIQQQPRGFIHDRKDTKVKVLTLSPLKNQLVESVFLLSDTFYSNKEKIEIVTSKDYSQNDFSPGRLTTENVLSKTF